MLNNTVVEMMNNNNNNKWCLFFFVKRAVTVVSPLMGSGATLASKSPQWALVVGGYPVGSRATLTWLNASVPARSNWIHCLEGQSEVSWYS